MPCQFHYIKRKLCQQNLNKNISTQKIILPCKYPIYMIDIQIYLHLRKHKQNLRSFYFSSMIEYIRLKIFWLHNFYMKIYCSFYRNKFDVMDTWKCPTWMNSLWLSFLNMKCPYLAAIQTTQKDIHHKHFKIHITLISHARSLTWKEIKDLKKI